MTLTGDLTLASNGGDIDFSSSIDGAYSIALEAGLGDVNVYGAIGSSVPLVNCTVVGNDILLSGVGSASKTLSGALSVNAASLTFLYSQYYAAYSQQYSASMDTNLVYSGLEVLRTSGGPITFTSGQMHINHYDLGTSLSVITNGGDFSFVQIHGTSYPSLTVDAGLGIVTFGGVDSTGTMGPITINAGAISFAGDTYCSTGSFTAQNAIANEAAQVLITSTGDMTFNSVSSNVASIANPLLVNAGGQVFAGSHYLSAFDGTTSDSTIHEYAPNPSCVIYFNGVQIAACTPPSPSLPSVPATLFATPGFNSSFFNLANDFFFLPSTLDKKYFKKSSFPNLYYISIPSGRL